MGNMTSQALRNTVRRVAARNQEIKYWDRTVTPGTLTTTWTIAPMSQVLESVGDQTRIGTEIDWVDWMFKFSINPINGAGVGFNPRTRIVLFQWHADAFNDPPFSITLFGSTTADPMTPIWYYLVKSGKIKVLYDKTFLANSQGGTDVQRHEIYIPHTRGTQKIYFNPGSFTNQGTNHLYLAYGSDDNLNGTLLSYSSRVRYTDS